MSLFKKIKSIFLNQEHKNIQNETKTVIKQNATTQHKPITYNYKTAKEMAKEPIPAEERNWILRFQNKECPYCHYLFDEIKGNRKCPECKNKIIVRTHFQTKEKCILTEKELLLFEKKKTHYYDTRWCIRECGSKLGIAEEEFMKEWKKRGRAYSPFDIMWYFINVKRIEYAQKNFFGMYRNTFSLQAQQLDREGKEERAYRSYLYLAYIDANGPTNNGLNPFDPTVDVYTEQAPHTLEMIKHYSLKFNKTLDDVKQDFFDVTRNEKNNVLFPLDSKSAWKLLMRDYKKYFEDKD